MRGPLLVVVVLSCGLSSALATHKQPQPIAALDLHQFFPPDPASNPRSTNIAFLSDSVIATGACKTGNCLLVLSKWEGGALRPFAQTHAYFVRSAICLTGKDNILTFQESDERPAHLYSSDLSTRTKLLSLQKSSKSGNTVAKSQPGSWNIYRLDPDADPKLELIRSVPGGLQSISDEAAVFHDDGVIRTETLQGKLLGSFNVKSWCYSGVELGARDSLYLHECKGFRVVDFNGTEQLRLRVPRGSHPYVAWSASRKRVLSDNFSRRTTFGVVGWPNLAFATLALVHGVEWAPNRERVQVMDTATGKSCFELGRSFAEGSENGSYNAAISPSGDFLALAVEGILSVYRLPASCGL